MADGSVFAYVSHTDRNRTVDGGEIRVLRLDPDSGDVSPVQHIPMSGKAMPIAISPDRRFLFVAQRSQPFRVASFAIDALSGKLTHLADTPLPDSMAYISTDRTGRYLFGSSTSYNARPGLKSPLISVSAIGVQGFVQPAHQIVRTEPKAHAILPDPTNRYVFVTSCNADLILRQVFDPVTGMLSPDSLPPVRVQAGAGPRHFVFHPNGRRLYLLTEPGAWVYVYDYDARNGSLTELQIVSAAPPGLVEQTPHGADVRITPDGRFLYASERASHTLGGFKIDLDTGLLTHIGNFPTEQYPRSFAIDPYGRHVLSVGHKSNGMTSYSIDQENGTLTKLKEYPMGVGPNWIEIVRLT